MASTSLGSSAVAIQAMTIVLSQAGLLAAPFILLALLAVGTLALLLEKVTRTAGRHGR